jgi:hypothetical protein
VEFIISLISFEIFGCCSLLLNDKYCDRHKRDTLRMIWICISCMGNLYNLLCVPFRIAFWFSGPPQSLDHFVKNIPTQNILAFFFQLFMMLVLLFSFRVGVIIFHWFACNRLVFLRFYSLIFFFFKNSLLHFRFKY